MKPVTIYKITDTRDNVIKYVGATTATLNSRMSQHIYDSKNKNRNKWLYEAIQEGYSPKIEKLEDCSIEEYPQKEIFYISKFATVSNLTKGGTGIVLNRTSESIQRSASAKFTKVYQYDLKGKFIKEWDSLVEASNTLNISYSGMTNSLIGLSKSCGGFQWRSQFLESTQEYSPNNSKKVILQNTITGETVEFSSKAAVERFLKIDFYKSFKTNDIVIKNYKLLSKI